MSQNLELRGGKYYLRVMIGGVRYRRPTGFSDPKLAKRRAVEMENEIRSGRLGWIKPAIPRFDDWVAKYIAAYYEPPAHPHQKRLLHRVVNAHGTRMLDMITRSDIETYFRDREMTAAKGTLELERVTLKSVFRAAIEDRLIAENPMAHMRGYDVPPRTRVMTRDEEAIIRLLLAPTWLRFMTIVLATGLRKNELMMARPCDLRSEGLALWVRPESNKRRKGRVVPLRREAVEAFQEQRAAHKDPDLQRCYFRVGWNSMYNALRRACKKSHIEPSISVHDLRRTFGTRCAEAGMHPPHLKDIMGHKSINVTLTHYVHLSAVSIRDALLKVEL